MHRAKGDMLLRASIVHICGNEIYPSELQLNKADTSDTEATLSMSNDIVSTKIDDKRDDFDFENVQF